MKSLKTAEQQYKINIALDEFNEGTISYNTLKIILDDINGVPISIQQEEPNQDLEVKKKPRIKKAMAISFIISFLITKFTIR